jgi:hypothetical protein
MPEPIVPNPGDGTEIVPPVAPTPEPVIQPPTPPAPTEPDYKEKFSESSRENQLLLNRIKVLEDAGKEPTNAPTESELRTAFPSWDLYDDTQKELARRTFGSERTASNAVRIAQTLQSDREWNTSIELAISSDPALQGKEQAFKQFALKPQYKNVPMDVLIGAFLQKNGAAAPTPTPAPAPKPGLEPGNGGPRTPDKPKTYTAEEMKTIRETDYRRWMEIVKSGAYTPEV